MTDLSKTRSAYREFFLKSSEGKDFLTHLESLIRSFHDHAEQNPDSARDDSQKAAGIREVLNHITVVASDLKKGRDIG